MKIKTNSNTKTFRLRIILLPEKQLSKIFVFIAKKYSRLSETYYRVDGIKHLPHLTVYLGDFPVSVRYKVFNKIESISQKHSIMNLEFEKVDTMLNWLWLRYKLTGSLKRLHTLLLQSLKSLGEVHSFNTLENYQPHLSLLRYKKRNIDVKVIGRKDVVDSLTLNQKWNYLALANDEEHGTVTKIIKKYKLNA